MILIDAEDVMRALAVIESKYSLEKEYPEKSNPELIDTYRRGRNQGLLDSKNALKKLIMERLELAERWIR